MGRRRIPLRLEIPLVLGLAALVATTIVSIWRVVVLRREAERTELAAFRSLLVPLADLCTGQLQAGDLSIIRRQIAMVALDHQITCLALTDDHQAVLAGNQWRLKGRTAQDLDGFDPRLAAEAMAANQVRFRIDQDRQRIIGYAPIQLGRESGEIRSYHGGVLFGTFDFHQTRGIITSAVIGDALIIGGGFILLGLLTSLVLHLRVSRRLTRLVAEVDQIGGEGPGGSARGGPGSGDGDEIDRLGHALRAMARRIEADHRELADSENRFRTMIEQAPMAVSMSRGTVFHFCNQRFVDLVGLERIDQVIGTPFVDRVAPRDQTILADRARRRELGEPVETAYDLTILRPDGQEIEVQVTAERIHFPDGPATVGVFSDVTEARRAERLRRETEERLRLFLETMPIGVAWSQPDGRIEFINQAFSELFGYTLAEVPTVEAWYQAAYPAPEAVAEQIAHWREVFAHPISGHRQIPPAEGVVRCRDGSQRTVMISGAVVAERILATFVDLTERSAMEARLRGSIAEHQQARDEIARLNADLERRVEERTASLTTANHELESFSYSVSHDQRAPLRAIAGFSQALEEDLGAGVSPLILHHLQRIQGAATRMGSLIDALLQLSRIGRQELHWVGVDVSAIAVSVAQELCPVATAHRLNRSPADRCTCAADCILHCAFDPLDAEENPETEVQPLRHLRLAIAPGLRAEGDPRLIRVVLENLLSNALKFTATKADVRIDLTAEPGSGVDAGRMVFHLRDNGVGFDPIFAGKLFGEFQRLHPADQFPGTGIGLATVRRIITRHGGRVWADSQVDAGATFSWTLSTTG